MLRMQAHAQGGITWAKRGFGCMATNMGLNVVKLVLQMRARVAFSRSETAPTACMHAPALS